MKVGGKFRIDWRKVQASPKIKGLPMEMLLELKRKHENDTLTALSVGATRVWFKYPDTQKGFVHSVSLGLTKLGNTVKTMKVKSKGKDEKKSIGCKGP